MLTIHNLVSRYNEEKRRFDTKLQVRLMTNLSLYCARFQNACHLLAYKGDIFNLARSHSLGRMQMHWICPLCKLSTSWAQQVERIWTPCWEVLSGDESCWFKFETGQTFSSTPLNILLVSRSSMRGSTKSSAFAQQRSICWAPRTRSAQRIQRFSWSTWAFVKSSDCSTCQSLLRSFEHRAQQHLKKHSTC